MSKYKLIAFDMDGTVLNDEKSDPFDRKMCGRASGIF